MNAAKLLQSAREAGLHLQVEGEDLVLEAAAPPPASLIDLLKEHKAEVIGLLCRETHTWSTADWLAYYDERAGIAEYDGGLPRAEAEALAYAGCVAEWLDQNPVCSSPDRCLQCGEPDHLSDSLTPFGIEPAGPAWLHHRCWDDWQVDRKDTAVAALSAVSITEDHPRSI